MNDQDLIEQLQALQIQQNEIIKQLSSRATTTSKYKVGDKVKLLTKGVSSKKGDTAIVTKVTSTTVYLKVIATNHLTRRHCKNISKVKSRKDER